MVLWDLDVDISRAGSLSKQDRRKIPQHDLSGLDICPGLECLSALDINAFKMNYLCTTVLY